MGEEGEGDIPAQRRARGKARAFDAFTAPVGRGVASSKVKRRDFPLTTMVIAYIYFTYSKVNICYNHSCERRA